MPELGEFEGKAVRETTMAIHNAGDGLSEAMKTEPVIMHEGDEVYIVLRGVVSEVRFKAVKPGSTDLVRVHRVRAGTATLIEMDVVREAIDLQEEKNTHRREQEAGVSRLPVDEHNLRGAHVLGEHADGLVDNCPLCEDEAEAAAEEEAGAAKKA